MPKKTTLTKKERMKKARELMEELNDLKLSIQELDAISGGWNHFRNEPCPITEVKPGSHCDQSEY
jgi:hypothetical protein